MAFDTLLELYMGHLPICMQTRMKLYIDMVSFICPVFVPYALSAINAILQQVLLSESSGWPLSPYGCINIW